MADEKDARDPSAPDLGRRSLLVGGAIGAAASLGGIARSEAAQPAAHKHGAQAQAAPHAAAPHAARQGAFLNDDDYATIVAVTERLMPGAPGKPGAKDANVANYIDLALAGFYVDQQYFYRQGLAALDAFSNKEHGKSFMFLSADKQDQVLATMDEGKATGFTWPAAKTFFERLRTHTIEGMFADPVYGGNRDFAGWRLVGFPGAQPLFTEADMKSGKPFTREPIVGLQQAQARTKRG